MNPSASPAPQAGFGPFSATPQASSSPVDIGDALDAGPFTPFQSLVVLMAAASIMFDGFDSQLLGYAIPVLIREWGIGRNAFAPVVAVSLIGMGIGSACAGLLADRFGRRRVILGSVLVFGAVTCLVGLAPNIQAIAALRFVAGLGIGGALPSCTTMAAEYTPARYRTVVVTATIVCVPLGGMVAGLFASALLPAYGWRSLFFIGGVLPLILSCVLFFALPESPRFLARRAARWPELAGLLGRMGRRVDARAAFADAKEQAAEKHVGFTALFKDGRALDSAAIWCAFFMCLLAVYSAFSWLPTMLTSAGLSREIGITGLTAYNLGGVLGALACSVVVARVGSRWPLLACALGAAASALGLMGVNMAAHTSGLMLGLGLHGLFVNAVQSVLYPLCAHIYTTGVRATGTASALAFGRLGAILSAFAGAAVITAGGAPAYLTMLGAAMMVVALALAVVRQHIPGRTARETEEAASH